LKRGSVVVIRRILKMRPMLISENNKNFAALSSENKCIWLLSNEDAVICQKLALFNLNLSKDKNMKMLLSIDSLPHQSMILE
jgi:hypothetical protein